jgi:hypothetical protein
VIGNLLLRGDRTGLKVRSVIIESDYIDRDSNIAYTALYARAYKDYPRRTVRLHFFRESVTFDDLVNLKKVQDLYVGYSVLSPIQAGTIGRTVLPSPDAFTHRLFVPSASSFSVNLAGLELTSEGTAFIEQDGRIAACASAATWMSTAIAAKRLGPGAQTKTMTEITHLATMHSRPSQERGATPGLGIPQIAWALFQMGYEPMVHVGKDHGELTEIIYQYVESGLPAILVAHLQHPDGPGYHALTVVGHCYDPNVGSPNPKLSTSAWCPRFLVHDDQRGPYLMLSLKAGNAESKGHPIIEFDESCIPPGPFRENTKQWYHGAWLRAVIAPLPARHLLRPEQALIKGRAILHRAFEFHKDVCGPFPTHPVFRTYLASSNAYRSRFVTSLTSSDSGISELQSDLARWYAGATYSRFIWVTELCDLSHRQSTEPEDLRVLADVTVDATSGADTADFLTLHIPKMFFRASPNEPDEQAFAIPKVVLSDDQPYPPFVQET